MKMEHLTQYKYKTSVIIRPPVVNLYRDDMSNYITKPLQKQGASTMKVNNFATRYKIHAESIIGKV